MNKALYLWSIIVAFCLALTFTSCRKRIEECDEIKSLAEEYNSQNIYRAILLIPGAGCPGCISGAESFVKEYKDYSDLLFVFTNIRSVKLLQNKLGVKAGTRANIVFDFENNYLLPSNHEARQYPLVIYAEGSYIKKVLLISPMSDYSLEELLVNPIDPPIEVKISNLLKGKAKELLLSQICDSIEYIKLITPFSLPIGRIFQVEISNERIFILDDKNIVWMFSSSGKFIKRIGTRGRGPDEYVELNHFAVDNNNRILALPDYADKKILTFDFDGNLIGNIKTEYAIESLGFLSDSLYCFLIPKNIYFKDGVPISIIIAGKSGQEIATFAYTGDTVRMNPNLVNIGYLRSDKDGVIVHETDNDTTFLISNYLRKTPHIIAKLGKMKPPNYISESSYLRESNSMKYVFNLFCERFSNYIFVSFIYNNEFYQSLLDFHTNDILYLHTGSPLEGITDDINSGPPVRFMNFHDEYLVDVLQQKQYLHINPSDTIQTMTTDNPIIRVFHLK